jgi:acetylornithine deacetylase/succinyl-diaminopimelate desuccinylase-like protein
VIEGDRLYGRGGADDGYALFAALGALLALDRQGVPRPDCVVLIEACEESGSGDLPPWLAELGGRIGEPDLVVCLDSGCGDYERLWCTTSLRGLVGGLLRVEVLKEGVHSGDAGGVVPSTFRLARLLLSRVEDERDGRIPDPAFSTPVPKEREAQARAAAEVLGEAVWRRFPFREGATAQRPQPAEAILARTWRPALEVIGADGLPPAAAAGNVHRPQTALKLSLRLPPRCDADRATARLGEVLTGAPPHGARVTFEAAASCQGWDAPPLAPWLARAMDAASQRHFGAPTAFQGEGGSIPFMAMLGARFPRAQFLVTGVLGPGANAHGPNEFLHLPTARKVTACVADILAAQGPG